MSAVLDLSRLAEPPATETAVFNETLRATLAQFPQAHEVAPEVTRAARAQGGGLFPQGGPLEGSDWLEIPGAPGGPGRVRVSRPESAPRGVVLHFHGGGWTFGSPELEDARCQALARESGWAVASAAYRLAPENPWPACAEDAEAAARWLVEAAPALFGTDRLAVAGESAGAHLAAVSALRLAAAGLADRLAAAALTYGMFDLRMTPSMANWGPDSLILSTPTVDWFVGNLDGGDRGRRSDPAFSPLLADLAGFPPALIQVGTLDPLLDDSLFMAARLAAAGTPPALKLYPGGVHAFDAFDLPLAREARADVAAFIAAAG